MDELVERELTLIVVGFMSLLLLDVTVVLSSVLSLAVIIVVVCVLVGGVWVTLDVGVVCWLVGFLFEMGVVGGDDSGDSEIGYKYIYMDCISGRNYGRGDVR